MRSRKTESSSRPVASNVQNTEGNSAALWKWYGAEQLGNSKIRVCVGGPPKPCDLPTEPTPEGIDWDAWLGPAPMRGFNKILCPDDVHNHFPAWRRYREYCNGGLADIGAHHFDIGQWAMETTLAP